VWCALKSYGFQSFMCYEPMIEERCGGSVMESTGYLWSIMRVAGMDHSTCSHRRCSTCCGAALIAHGWHVAGLFACRQVAALSRAHVTHACINLLLLLLCMVCAQGQRYCSSMAASCTTAACAATIAP
jgi:hypothetical protein